MEGTCGENTAMLGEQFDTETTPAVQTEDTADSSDDENENSSGNGSNNSSSGNPEGFEWGNGNGEVPPGQNVDEDGNIVNNGGHMPPD